MHSTIKSASVRVVLLIATSIVAAVVAGCGPASEPPLPPVNIVNVTSDLAVDPADREAVAGWADAIFVGTVEQLLHTEASESRMPGVPETQFRVSVVGQLKGDLPAKVVVNQFGGTAHNGDLIVVNNMPLISTEKTYLFIARYYAEKKWLTIATGLGTQELVGPDAAAAKRADNNPANRDAEPESVKRMRNAIAHEKPFGDEGTRPKLPDPASLPSEVPDAPAQPTTPTARPTPTPTRSVTPAPSRPSTTPTR
ncbi:hypothetical protein [Nocardia sp. NPDC050175]|uniref:hypothetical protein n=1 Tax=Nocardia sp. NPDC050175 TaxID=3364317 RepID=UPI00378923D5